MFNLLSLFLFLIGAAWGSFLYLAALRFPKGEDVVRGRSACGTCARQLSFWESLPIVSYVWLLGKCRTCKASISWHYIAVEVAMGLLFIAGYQVFDLSVGFALFFFELSLLSLIFLIDLYTTWVYEMMVIPAILIILAIQFLIGVDPQLYVIGLAIGVFVFWIQYALSKGSWLGKGDIWIGALMGVMLGWKMLFVALVVSYVLGGIVAIYLVITKVKGRGDMIPFGPFLTTGTVIVLLYGQAILDWYSNLIGLPL